MKGGREREGTSKAGCVQTLSGGSLFRVDILPL